MSVSSATVVTPASVPRSTIVRASSRACVDVLHEGAGADLDVEHERAGALGDLLAHDRRRDQRDGLDRARDVAQRVQLLVGRGEAVAGRADDRADVLELRASSRRCDSAARQPGIDSSLSSVPPVWPRPRPDSCGTATPHAATSGASGSVILSPTPPVECLSAVGRDSPEKSIRSPRGDHRGGPAGDLAPVHAVEQDRHRQRRHLLVGDDAARVGVDHPVDLGVGQLAAVALGADDVDGVVRLAPVRRGHAVAPPGRSGPNASGSTSAIVRSPLHGLEDQLGPAVLAQQLAAAAARHQHVAVPVDAGERHEAPAAASRCRR